MEEGVKECYHEWILAPLEAKDYTKDTILSPTTVKYKCNKCGTTEERKWF